MYTFLGNTSYTGNNRFLLRTFCFSSLNPKTFRQIWQNSKKVWLHPSSCSNSTGLPVLPSSLRGGFCFCVLLTLGCFLPFHAQLFRVHLDCLDFINNNPKTIFSLKYPPGLPRLGILIIILGRISLSVCS